MAKLGEYIEQIRGVSYKPDNLHQSLNKDSVILLRANNIQDGILNFDDVVYVDKSKVKSIQYLQKGDIVVCASSGSKELVGKASYVKENMNVTFGAFCKVVRPKISTPKYIAHYFQSSIYRKAISNLSSGANINNIRNEHIDELTIFLPNEDIQVRIVNLLDKISSLIDLRKEQLSKLDELVKSRFIEMFEDCQNMVALNELCSVITDGTHQPPKFQSEGIPFIFVSNLANNTVTYNSEKFISEETYNELIKRTPIEVGDILLSTVGSYGHPAIVVEERKFLFQRHIAYLKPKRSLVNSFYLHSALLAPDGQRQIEEKVKGIAQKTLNLSEIRKIMIPIPSIEEQNSFETFIKQTDKLKFEVKQSLEQLETLKKSLMQQYFG
ncbi:MAG: restriction endonuclease subunit S [Acutalibacteraceae bacterium]|nr:restriction endonuclease subunit S [Acutalibacteraceae bacterium]